MILEVGKTYITNAGHKITIKNMICIVSQGSRKTRCKITYSYVTKNGKRGIAESFIEDVVDLIYDTTNVYDSSNHKRYKVWRL